MPVGLLDTMGKLLEEMILQRLQGHMVRENGLSENQFGFRKGKSTVDAIQAVVNIATKARRGTGKRKGFCTLISIDIRNAFNTAIWNICIEAMLRKKVPDYLSAGTSIIGFADNALVVCAADDVKILELRINDSLWRAKRWLDSRCLKMAPEKTEALLVTDRRSFKYPRIILREHLKIATAKAIQCGTALTRLMPNIGGPREAKRRLVACVVNSKLLYAAPIWTSALNNHAILKKLFSAQRGVVMRIVSPYRTVSRSAVLVLASVPPIDLLAEERKETFQLHKELICLTNLQEIAHAKEDIRKDGRRRLVEKWKTRWHGDQSGK